MCRETGLFCGRSEISLHATTSFTPTYDAVGKRVKATLGGNTYAYVGEWYKVGPSTRKYYSIGGQRVAMYDGSQAQVRYLLGDHLGSTAVQLSTSLVKEAEVRYDAWGGDRYTSGTMQTSYRYTGQRSDSGIGLYYYNARYYDALLGRFSQPDTIVPMPGNPQTLNRYTYGYNNPVKYLDPDGHNPIAAVLAIGSGPIGWAALGVAGALTVAYHYYWDPQAAAHREALAGNLGALLQFSNSKAGTGAAGAAGADFGDPNNWDPNKQGAAQEASVQQLLRKQGYKEVFGEGDQAIAQKLGLRGQKVADFVGQAKDRWLIAESKGSDLASACKQLENTMNALMRRNAASASNIDLRIYTNAEQYERLLANRLGGWELHNGFLGWYNESGEWVNMLINGVRVLVSAAP